MSTEVKTKGRKPITDWDRIDWNLSTQEIAEQHNLKYSTVAAQRIARFGKNKKTPKPVTPKSNTDRSTFNSRYDGIDFEAPGNNNSKLGREIGVSREAIRMERLKRGFAPYKANPREYMPTPAQDRLKALTDDELRTLSMAQLQERVGVCDESIRRFARSRGIRIRNGLEIYPYDQWNWDLPNSILDRVWHAPRNTAASARHRMGKDAMKWDIRFGHERNDPSFKRAIEKEEAKYEANKEAIRRYQKVRRVRRNLDNPQLAEQS